MASFQNMLTPAQRQSFTISFTAFLASLLLLALVSILVLIVVRGGVYFWPSPIYKAEFYDPATASSKTVYAQMRVRTEESGSRVWQMSYSDASHPFGTKTLVEDHHLNDRALATEAAQIDLQDGTTVFARPNHLVTAGGARPPLTDYEENKQQVMALTERIEEIRETYLSGIHEQLAELDIRDVEQDAPARLRLNAEFAKWQGQTRELEQQRNAYQLDVTFADGSHLQVPLADIERVNRVNQQSWWQKIQMVTSGIWTFLSESPKQANTSGGVFPALFGTVLMVFLMTIIVTPFGVLAAVYLSEYAPDNAFTAAIRVSVSNMAGVPSIVYGVFGLGFFVYTLGGNLDDLFFADRLPAPTMGTPGLFWAALTMAILTLPVVIVATEEGLRRVPDGLKAGSYALGATKAETVLYTILPIASPGIMTGVILAIARAAGEVAPLMLVGAVKFAPNLPLDGEFPYLHLDRQFMHLGVLIYDGAFHSQTDAKGASMMFAACLLLLVVVFVLNILAVLLRTRLRKRYLL